MRLREKFTCAHTLVEMKLKLSLIPELELFTNAFQEVSKRDQGTTSKVDNKKRQLNMSSLNTTLYNWENPQ